MMEPEQLILTSLFTLIIIDAALEIYIDRRQIKVYRSSTKVPKELENVMAEDTFEKARVYGLDRTLYSIYKTILTDVIIISLEIYFGFIAYCWHKAEVLTERFQFDSNNEIIVSCVFVILLNSITMVKDMPFKIYKTFVLEEKHGFNKETWSFFAIDQVKALVVGQIIFTPIAAGIVFVVQWGGDHFFIWLWLFTGFVTFLLLTIYPDFIAPLFDKYRPLEDGALRDSIERLAASLHFPLGKLYVVEGSKRSAHSNAYFYGLFGSKRIVLFDTLLLNKGKKDGELKEEEKGKGCTNEEVLAVLAHELGHWKLGHVTKNIVIMQVHLLLMFAAFGYLFQYDPFYRAIGFPVGKRPILVGLFIILSYVMAAYNAVIDIAMTMLSRHFEYQADDFANKLGYADELCRSLIKLNIDNLGFPIYDWLYSSLRHSHPTLLQRLDRLKENKKEK